MKAASRKKYCTPDGININNAEIPQIKPNEVLIKVMATTVNRTDCANLTAKPFIMRFVLGLIKPKQDILGTDCAGIVTQVGKEVTRFKIGDRVCAFNDMGMASQAEYTSIQEDSLYKIPDTINFNQAAASLEGAHYAYTFIHKVPLIQGQHILVNGATGAIGSALVQFLKQHDVTITATCRTEHTALVKSLGATTVIDYTKEDFTTTTNTFDYVFDTVGKSTFGKCKRILKEKGVYISSELGPKGQNLWFALLGPFWSKKKVIFPVPYKLETTLPYILTALGNKTFKPVIDKTYSLEDIPAAYAYAMSGNKLGNVVVEL